MRLSFESPLSILFKAYFVGLIIKLDHRPILALPSEESFVNIESVSYKLL